MRKAKLLENHLWWKEWTVPEIKNIKKIYIVTTIKLCAEAIKIE